MRKNAMLCMKSHQITVASKFIGIPDENVAQRVNQLHTKTEIYYIHWYLYGNDASLTVKSWFKLSTVSVQFRWISYQNKQRSISKHFQFFNGNTSMIINWISTFLRIFFFWFYVDQCIWLLFIWRLEWNSYLISSLASFSICWWIIFFWNKKGENFYLRVCQKSSCSAFAKNIDLRDVCVCLCFIR